MASANLTIRPEHRTDLPAIDQVHKLAFNRPYEASLVRALRDDPSYVAELSIVAALDDAIIAHVLFTVGAVRGRRGWSPVLLLAPIAVLPEHQRQGIGTFLVQRAVAACKQSGRGDVIVTIGSSDYYSRFGFVPADTLGLTVPFDVPKDNVMALKIGHLVPALGEIQYPRPFHQVP